jgi:hypothetical protein
MAMQEVKAPRLIQWTRQGEVVEGIFSSIEIEVLTDQSTKEQKNVRAFFFDLPNEERCKIRETADLGQKIQPRYLGRKMRIRYESENKENQKAGQSAMKVFKVEVDDRVAPGYEHLQAA